MKFDAKKMLSEEKWLEMLDKHLGHNKEDCIELGSLDFSSVPDLIVAFFDKWIFKMDKKVNIARILTKEDYGEIYRRLMYERGLTFEEYRTLFDNELEEKEYQHYPAYEFLQISTKDERRLFINKYEPHVEAYCNLIQNINLTGADFFLKRLKSQISIANLKKHCYISGKSGSGKSSLLLSMFYNIQKLSHNTQQYSLVLIDAHGDLAEEATSLKINHIKQDRLIYINPCLDSSFTPVLNPFELKDRSNEAVELTAQMLVAVFEELLGDAGLTMYMSTVLFPCIVTLLKKDGATLADLQIFMSDEQNAALVKFAIEHNHNLNHVRFFKTAFYDKTYEKTKMAIYTRLNSLLNTQLFYNAVVGKSTIDLEDAMDKGKVIIVNASKGRLGLQASSAFGRFVIASLQSIAIRRASKQKHDRKSCFVFIDECQNFLTKSISIILTEARKYGLHLILSNQSVSDLGENKDNILNNTDVKLIGRNGNKSLVILAKETGVSVAKLSEIPKYSFYAKVGDIKPFVFETSSMLVKEQRGSEIYYLNDNETEEQKQYFIKKSGYYLPVNKVDETNYNNDNTDKNGSFTPKFDK